MKRWYVSYVAANDKNSYHRSQWIEVHGESLNVQMLVEDLKKQEFFEGAVISILSIYPEIIEKGNDVHKTSTSVDKKKKKINKNDKPELGKNRVKIVGPLSEELKMLIGQEADVIGEEGQNYVLLTPAGLYPNIPKNSTERI